jgi:glucose/arabinose dehydrogenase
MKSGKGAFVGLLSLAALAGAGCSEGASLPASAGTGPRPALPEPTKTLIPTVKVATAIGWEGGTKPTAAAGLDVTAFAAGLAHPRWLYVLPNGDVLVAETNAPERPEENKGVRAWVMKRMMKKAGAATPSANRITLLRDADGDGAAETRATFVDGLRSPLGMALVGEDFYVANTDGIVRFRYVPGTTTIVGKGTPIASLPAGRRNHHWTKNLVASRDGKKLYASVGSNSNAGENGMDDEVGRAAIWEIDLETGKQRVFASGLRNPVGMAFEPQTNTLWTVVNERDELGSDVPPDYLTSVREGGFYGWPYSYFGNHVDARVKPQRPDLVATAIVPDYAVGAHTASLGLAFSRGAERLPPQFANGAFIGQHGSWNRRPPAGYEVVFVPFIDGRPTGQPISVLGGFLTDQGEARGRPVGVAIAANGALLVADDVGNAVWRVGAPAPASQPHALVP